MPLVELAVKVTGVPAVRGADCGSGLRTKGGASVIAQAKFTVAAAMLSFAVSATAWLPSCVGTPVMRRVAELMLRPGGRPVALSVIVWPASGSETLMAT